MTLKRKFIVTVIASVLIFGALSIHNAYADTSVSSCGTLNIPGETYVISNDLTASGNCLTISADDVTLDGNGHRIIGNGNGIGVLVNGVDRIVIQNVNVANFQLGMQYHSAEGGTVQGNDINSNSIGISLFRSNEVTITGNSISNNNFGIGAGIILESSDNNIISDNNIGFNTRGIFMVGGSDNNLITNNFIHNLANRGVEISSSSDNIIAQNTFWNMPEAIHISTFPSNLSFSNQIYNNNFFKLGDTPVIIRDGNLLNLPAPIGGNYWDFYDETSEGCFDTIPDGFCDDPLELFSVDDNLPWTRPAAPIPPNDSDKDGVVDVYDNCFLASNSDQSDVDGDGVGDVCDNAPEVPNPDQRDKDGDGVGDVIDNCLEIINPDQADSDGNGIGDECTANIRIEKTGTSLVQPGGPVTFTITVTNEGPGSSQAASILDILPTVIIPDVDAIIQQNPDFQMSVFRERGQPNFNIVSFSQGGFASGQVAEIIIIGNTIEDSLDGQYDNIAQLGLSSKVFDPDTSDNQATFTFTLSRNSPPDCTSATPSVSSLWPPNHKFVDILISGVTDADGDAVSITIDAITQDEPVNDDGDGNTTPDGKGIGTNTAMLRAERSGNGDGRVYEISFTADDGNGGVCTGAIQVGVPHDKKDTAIDSSQTYDSTKP